MPDFYDLSTEVEVPAPIRIATASGDVIVTPPTRRQVREIQQAPTGEESNQALFRDAYPLILSHFDELPAQHWESFMTQVNAHFFGVGADASPGKSPA